MSTENRPIYGCHNRAPFKQICTAKDGTTWPFRQSQDCQYSSTELGQQDSRCDGCKHRFNPGSDPHSHALPL